MKLRMITTFLMAMAFAGTAWSGSYGHRNNSHLYDAAYALEQAAYYVHDELDDHYYGRDPLVNLAYDIHAATEKFTRHVKRGRSAGKLWDEFEVIADCFDDLRYKIKHRQRGYGRYDKYGLIRFERALARAKRSLISAEAYAHSYHNGYKYRNNRTYTRGNSGYSRNLPARPFYRY